MTQTRVAKEAGIPQGHLTYYFPKKRDLVLGVAKRFAQLTGERMLTFFGERSHLPTAEVLRAYTLELTADRERTRMVLGLLVMSEEEPELARVLQRNANMLRAMLAPVLKKKPSDPMVDLILALLWGAGLHEFVLRAGKTEAIMNLGFALAGDENPTKTDTS